MAALQDREAKYNEEKKLFTCLVDLLSYEKITFNGELKISTRFLEGEAVRLSQHDFQAVLAQLCYLSCSFTQKFINFRFNISPKKKTIRFSLSLRF